MKQTNLHILMIGGIILCLSGCDQTTVPPLSLSPVIRVDSLSHTEIREFEEQISIFLFYRDENGDIGDPDPDEHSLQIKDSRLSEADTWHVQPVTLPGDEVPVEGVLEIDLGKVFLLGNGTEERFFYTILLKDRAGNWSEPVETSMITVRK